MDPKCAVGGPKPISRTGPIIQVSFPNREPIIKKKYTTLYLIYDNSISTTSEDAMHITTMNHLERPGRRKIVDISLCEDTE